MYACTMKVQKMQVKVQHWMSFSYEQNLKCPLLEIETELQPEYLCIMQSSHIPDVLCLHSPTGPPHSSLNNMMFYNPSVYLSLLILVRLPKPSNIGSCQKKQPSNPEGSQTQRAA